MITLKKSTDGYIVINNMQYAKNSLYLRDAVNGEVLIYANGITNTYIVGGFYNEFRDGDANAVFTSRTQLMTYLNTNMFFEEGGGSYTGVNITSGTTPPTSPAIGDIWIDTSA